ncbi:LysM peptidoglycan-binding domain-containing protein [Microbacterium sp. cf046]|uniref:LysM peptidoglycan-binding domain-containing protein n=1 Tax=Microbacterium sp. cf046 TaxID=1761803 RepID=UPI0020C8FBB8|nr:LysM peptidoglycan-binding domain-containing protein [Microbacterium sp. cf046]
MPVALVGSLAILMSASPAGAAEPTRSGEHKAPRVLAALDGSRGTPSSVRVPAAAAPDTYTVQAGDTISAIASRHGLRTVDVLAINGLDWSSIIYPGQVLRLAAAPAAAAPPAETPAAAGAYVVQAGDTISAIADRHGVSIPAVFAANGLDWSSIIYPGQTLAIAGGTTAAPPAAAEPAPTPAPPASVPPAGSYVVQAGDTISAIAHLHGLSTQALLDANGLTGSSIIFPDQTITIPSAALVLVAVAAPAASTSLDAEQIANAQLIIGVGRELGVSDRGIAIALGTAMQESWLRNLDWGDRDSLGLFQQRPSTGWGTPEEVSDPVRAARAFYGGPSDPNGSTTRGLLDIPGWESLSFADAAQAVQISAYPDRYAQWEQPAYAWLAAHG